MYTIIFAVKTLKFPPVNTFLHQGSEALLTLSELLFYTILSSRQKKTKQCC